MPMRPQGVLPDVSNLIFVSDDELIDGRVCQRWENVSVHGAKKNVYTLWVTNDERQAPARYEMKGYDSLVKHFQI